MSAPLGARVYNAVLSLLFHLGSMLGSEIMYITFFPFVFWNIDLALARRLVYMWCITMYLGQGLKVAALARLLVGALLFPATLSSCFMRPACKPGHPLFSTLAFYADQALTRQGSPEAAAPGPLHTTCTLARGSLLWRVRLPVHPHHGHHGPGKRCSAR